MFKDRFDYKEIDAAGLVSCLPALPPPSLPPPLIRLSAVAAGNPISNVENAPANGDIIYTRGGRYQCYYYIGDLVYCHC